MNPEKLYSSSFDEAADHILDLLSRLLNLNTLFVAVNDGKTNRIMKALNRGQQLVKEGMVLPFFEAYCSLVPNKFGGSIVIPSTKVHASTATMAVTEKLGDHSFVGMPIRLADGSLYGTLCAMDQPGYPFSDWEIRTLHSMAMFLTYTVELEAENALQKERTNQLARRKQEDETRIQQLSQRHRTAQAKLSRNSDLLAMVSHEVRNSLNGNIGMTELMQQSEMSEELQTYVKFMEDSNKNLLQLLDNVLDYSKLDEGEMNLEIFPLDLLSLIEDSMFLYASQAQLKNLELLLDLNRELPLLYGDAGKIRQIVLNLLSNAIKFTSSGNITIQVRSNPIDNRPGYERVYIAVSDTGIGMTADEQEMLFQKYSRPHEGQGRQELGTGLGLYISRQLTELMGGKLEVESKPGKGSRFFFWIELKSEPMPLVQLNHKPVVGKRVLLLDDSEELLAILGSLLTSWGIHVSTCSEPMEIMSLLEQGYSYDALIVDENLGGSDTLEALLAEAAKRSLPIILMAPIGSTASPKLHEQARTLLTKPIRRLYLLHALTVVLGSGE
ncbi:ATP-binding protein [Paenibacillus herberti]|uniref:Circadian input-output histidine kinase CikA n=1 Tax=Paenibacillus herberti TaxID=1619309 RepID=A0A229NUN4_9BACL|nr:ATP-binding protein [Paenibacillus herberti]OXM13606.1 hypothetical protein CGZ75_21520 [Paenibacillus herberti]